MLCRTWTDDIGQYFEQLKEYGFEVLEISLYGNSLEKLQAIFDRANELGFDIVCGTGVSPDTDPSSSDESIREAAIQYLKTCIDTASAGHAKMINGVLASPWQAFSKEDLEIRWRNSAKTLQVVAAYAKEKGIQLNLEVINRFESDFMNTLAQGKQFLELVNCDNVKLLVDTFHMNIEESNMLDAIRENIEVIGCIHICENHRGVPGTGHIDFAGLVKLLKELNYQGNLDMETFVESGTEVGDALFIWRETRMEKTPIDEAIKGIKYMKKIMEGNHE